VHPEKGKFRSFLLACLNNYVQNERDKQQAEKRGGGQIEIRIDIHEAETGLGFEPSDPHDPATIFERKWASVLIQHVLRQLREKRIAAGKSEIFETLQPFITGDAGRGDYGVAATRLHLSEGATRVAATRLREEFRILLRAEVGRTVSSASEIDDEIRHLLRVFCNS
jgi:RNA polymerase sigma-70 factor (ECF subfamily)